MESVLSPNAGALVRHLPARYDYAAAAAFFTRAGWGRLFGLLGHPAPPVSDSAPGRVVLPRLERLWMPWYAVEFVTELRQRRSTVAVALDAWSGMVVLFDRAQALEEGRLTEPCFSAPFSAEKAVELARNGLFQVILRRRGQLNKPIIKECRTADLFYMPLWAYYHRRLLRYIDVRLMDAYTGQASGGRLRNGVLNAIVAHGKGSKTGGEGGI